MLAESLAAVAGLVLLVGCAAEVAQPRLAADHPANPDAAVAPLPRASETLAVAATAPPANGAPEGAHDHSAMQDDRDGQEQEGGAGQQGAADAHHHHDGHHGAAPPTAQPTARPEAATRPAGGAALYACPHHPEVTSDKPGQTCPKCRMKLVKKEAKPDAGAGHGGHQ